MVIHYFHKVYHNMELAKQLKTDGIAKGLCQQYQGLIERCENTGQLVGLFFRGIDFCIKKDYPTLDFIRENFKGKCEAYGVFVDAEIQDLKNAENVALNGDCKAMLEYDGYSVSNLFVRHNSQVSVNVSGRAVLDIDAFDNSNLVVAVAGNTARVRVTLYGNAHVQCMGSGIKVIKKNQKTY